MRLVGQRIIAVLILIGLAGCANLVQPGASPLASPLPVPTGVILQYQRIGGIGGFDETWVIEGNGRVTHTGRGAGADRQLTPDQMAQLLRAIRTAEMTSLDESYIPQNTCCDRFTHVLTMTLDGQTKTVRTLDGTPDEPAVLTDLLTTLTNLLK
jgi:hypothetical protein